jgi:hypothetical protein
MNKNEIIVLNNKTINQVYMNMIFDVYINEISFYKTEHIFRCTVHIHGAEYVINIHLL